MSKDYWVESEFLKLFAAWQVRHDYATVERIAADFMMPLARHYCRARRLRVAKATGVEITHDDMDDIAQIAAIRCVRYLDRFDPSRGFKAHNYFTKIAARAVTEPITKILTRRMKEESLDAMLVVHSI